MKIVRFMKDEAISYGVLEQYKIQPLKDKPFDDIIPSGPVVDLSSVTLLAPCEPTKIVALGLNYHSHAREMGQNIPNAPLIFLKPVSAVIGPCSGIIYPSISSRVDFEGELALVIGKPAWRIEKRSVKDYIFGYACFNDVTARDLQASDGQWTRAKGFDTFAAIGPWLETELDANAVDIETRLNGQVKQKSNTSDLIYSIEEIVNFISNVMTLKPGDIIATGTPAGIGPMKPGDTVEVTIKGIGTLKNHVVTGTGNQPLRGD